MTIDNPADGYSVIDSQGRRAGTVVGVWSRFFMVELRHWFRRTRRAVPNRYVDLNHENRTAAMTITRQALLRSRLFKPDEPVVESRVEKYYGLEPDPSGTRGRTDPK